LIHLNIGYSPCPNDTYIMAALAQDKVDTPLTFNPLLADVETLNQWALAEKLEVTKLSFMALGMVRNSYGLLYAGAALGSGCGPLVVARRRNTRRFDRRGGGARGSYHCTPLAESLSRQVTEFQADGILGYHACRGPRGGRFRPCNS
jgi:hypothetical protein